MRPSLDFERGAHSRRSHDRSYNRGIRNSGAEDREQTWSRVHPHVFNVNLHHRGADGALLVNRNFASRRKIELRTQIASRTDAVGLRALKIKSMMGRRLRCPVSPTIRTILIASGPTAGATRMAPKRLWRRFGLICPKQSDAKRKCGLPVRSRLGGCNSNQR